MPILPVVGRRSLKMRLVVLSIYLILAVLGVGMVYPFLMTMTASVSGPMDYDRYAPVPRSLWSREERFVGGLPHFFPETMRNGMLMFALSFDGVPDTWTTWKGVGDDEAGISRFARPYLAEAAKPAAYRIDKLVAADYAAFSLSYPLSDCICTFDEQAVGPYFRDRYRAAAVRRKGTGALDDRALNLMSADWGLPMDTFYAFRTDREFQAPWDQGAFVPFIDGRSKSFAWVWQAYRDREFVPGAVKGKWNDYSGGPFPPPQDATAAVRQEWAEYVGAVTPMCETRPFPMKLAWLRYLGADDTRKNLGIGGGGPLTVQEYNRAFGTSYRRLRDVPFPFDKGSMGVPPMLARSPAGSGLPGLGSKAAHLRLNGTKRVPARDLRACWADFVKNQYPRRMIEVRVTPQIQTAFREFIRARCHGDLQRFNKLIHASYRSWDEVVPTPRLPMRDLSEAGLWMQFLGKLPTDSYILHSAEADYQAFLLAKYGSLDEVNRAYGWSLTSIRQAEMPLDSAYLVTFVENERPLYVSSLTRNYRFVIDYLFNREKAVWNTTVLIVLSLLAVLTVNPLAAYALSRFQLRQTASVILFLLATMAFPVTVSMIPSFLLMRDLHMLNTYAALILPGLANGYSIFLLKGFFDSLPAELYEAATLDGAKEWQIFMRITRPLSTPILAVIALNCFMATYAAWEWAFVVCQKESMWTVSVWLYKFSKDWAGQPWLVMASFVIASLPVFLVFLTCQKIILRGIILPQMK